MYIHTCEMEGLCCQFNHHNHSFIPFILCFPLPSTGPPRWYVPVLKLGRCWMSSELSCASMMYWQCCIPGLSGGNHPVLWMWMWSSVSSHLLARTPCRQTACQHVWHLDIGSNAPSILSASGQTSVDYFDIPNTLKDMYIISNLLYIHIYTQSNSGLPLPPPCCTKMTVCASVVPGLSWKSFNNHFYGISM